MSSFHYTTGSDNGSNETSDRQQLQSHHQQQQQQQQQLQGDARFSCSICTESVIEPVVTHCGHLYCWSCLYRWLENGMTTQERNELLGVSSIELMTTTTIQTPYDPSRRVCPVCRAPCSVKRVIPIYVRTDAVTTNNTRHQRNGYPTDIVNADDGAAESNGIVDGHEQEEVAAVVAVEMITEDDDYDDDMVVVPDEHDDTDHYDELHTASSDITSLLHSTGLRNRSRIRSSISEESSSIVTPSSNTSSSMFDSGTYNNNHNNFDDYDGTNTASSNETIIPRRPVARSSSNLRLAEHADIAAASAAAHLTAASSSSQQQQHHHHPASLAHGMLPLVQQALRHAAIAAAATTGGAGGSSSSSAMMTMNSNSNDYIPPIHRLEGMNLNQQQSSHYNSNNNNSIPPVMDYNDRTSPDFLSWILLLLGIFVLANLIFFF